MSEPPNTEALLATVRQYGGYATACGASPQREKEMRTALDAIASELERVRAERDDAKKELWSDRGVMLDMQARLDRAVEALREIASISGAGGSGEIPAMPITARARAALAEIEESG